MSLFGSLGGGTSNTPKFTLNPPSSQPTNTPSIFGGLGASSAPASSASLGASTFGTSDSRGASIFGSLLGNNSTASTAQNAQSQAQPTQSTLAQADKTLQPAYFNALLERGRSTQSPNGLNSSFGQLPSLQLNLSDISSRARELAAGHSQQPLRSTLSGSTAVEAAPSTSTFRPSQAPAQAAPNRPKHPDPLEVDNDKFIRGIQQRSRQAMIEENFARTQRDFDAYLEESLSLDWDAQRRKIYEHFGLAQKFDDKDESLNFANTTKGAFGKRSKAGRSQGPGESMRSSAARSILGKSAMDRSVIGSPGMGPNNANLFSDVSERNGQANAGDDRFTREREDNFAREIAVLNKVRHQRRGFPILHDFAAIEEVSGGETPSQIIEAYQALISITSESPDNLESSARGALKERQFAPAHLSEKPNSPDATALRRKILDGSRRFLEKQCYREVEKSIAQNPREAQLGGIPTVVNKIRAYVRIQSARKNLVLDEFELQTIGDNDMCWPLIFYLLRCGFVREAADYVSKEPHFRAIDRNFITYLTTYASSSDRRLPRALQEKINAEYQQRSRNNPEHSVDPYRLACYKIVGRCELHHRNLDNLPPKFENWIWLQFAMAREVNRIDEMAGDVFGLDELCNAIIQIGQRHFSKSSEGSAPFGTYFLLQILGGMFEHAIAYLYNYSYVSAVHFAIALDYYGLLRVSDFYTAGNELLTYTTRQQPQINFGRMIGYYTRDFRSGNAEAAVDYLTLICLNADLGGELGKSQASVCHEALRELVLETREFAKLLGDIRTDGTRIRGAIEERLRLVHLTDQEDFLNAVTVQAAAIADDSGRITDAVLLYHLAEDYDNVVDIINRALSEAMCVDLNEAPMKLQPLKPRSNIEPNGGPDLQRKLQEQEGSSLSLTSVEDPDQLAKNMIGLYNSNALYYSKIKPVNREACGLLLKMSEARKRIEMGKRTEALDYINSLDILPLDAKGSTPFIRSKATSFSSLPPVVAKTVGQLLLWCIQCTSSERARLRSAEYEDSMRAGMADQLMMMAKDLMVFAGMIRYQLPPSVFEALAGAGMDAGAY